MKTTSDNLKDLIADLVISKVLADEKSPFMGDFFNRLIMVLETEQQALASDKERYLSFVTNPLRERLTGFNFQRDIETIYNDANSPASPVRNGMILFGLYANVVRNS